VRGFFGELRRRRVFTTAGLYVVGAWLVMQAADVFFPGWGIPDTGINVLLVAAIIGFPVALVFGWFFNITTHGIMRTAPAGAEFVGEPRPLKGNDYFVLAMLLLVAGVIISYATVEILALQGVEPPPPSVEKLPNSIAVLPFDNISTDPDNEVFSDGVSEEVRNRLGQYGELQVIARASSFQFKGSDFGIPRIADLLGVRYLLQGSVRRQGDRIRVSAQLVAEQGTQLWSQNYDRILQDIFVIQDEIADLVAAEVAPQIVARHEGRYKPSLEAYKHFLAGLDAIYRRDLLAAREELATAIELDPGYAEAQAEYAISLLIGYPSAEDFQDADAAIDAALRLNPDLPRALAARGLFFSMHSPPDLVAAEAALREALKRDSNMVDAMNWLASAVADQGRHAESEEWQDRAYALDPFNAGIAVNVANRYWAKGKPDQAESMLRRLTELPEPPFRAFMSLSDLYTETGRLVEANRIAKRLLLAGAWQNFFLARSYAALGWFEPAEYWMSRITQDHPDLMWVRTGWVQAQIHYWRGDYRQAATEMRRAWVSNGLTPEKIPPAISYFYGVNQALAGDFAGAIHTLAAMLPTGVDQDVMGGSYGVNAYQALAWAYSQLGMADKSRQLLDTVEQWFARYRDSVVTVRSGGLVEAAQNSVLIGDKELALDRLEQAVAAGWRGYYVSNHDPRWGALKDDPRYLALMAEVKADVDRQQAEVERIDAEEDFPALLDQVRAAAHKPVTMTQPQPD